MTNRITLLLGVAILVGAASLTAQMRELGHWHGGQFVGPRSDWQAERRELREERRRELRERLRERMQERRQMREEFRREFRDSMRDLGRQWRFRPGN